MAILKGQLRKNDHEAVDYIGYHIFRAIHVANLMLLPLLGS